MARRTGFSWPLVLSGVAVLIVAVFLIAQVPRQGQPRLHTRSGFQMGTLVEISVYGDSEADAAVSLGFERVREIEHLMSKSIGDSDIARVNSAPIGSPVQVDPDTADIVSSAIAYAEATRGAFDPTMGALVDLWAIGSGLETVPSSPQIRDALLHVGYENLVVDEVQSEITRLSDLSVDLGAIAKGYATDEVVEVLTGEHVSGGVIDLGGNIRVFGTNPDRREWRIAIQDPFRPRGSYVGTVGIETGAVATSGDYERYFEADGVRYHHIFDPKSGYPASPDLRSVTVIAQTGLEADALSTGLFVLGVDAVFDFVGQRPSIEAIVITADRRVILSSGIADTFNRASEDFVYEIR